MITGGCDVDSTEILDTEDGKVTMASPMTSKRIWHGMGVITINGVDKLAAFGGHDGSGVLDSVEIYNAQTGRWETTDIKLRKPKHHFGFVTVKLCDVISKF